MGWDKLILITSNENN